MISKKICHQSKCRAALIQCLISLLVCAVFYVITFKFAPSFISSPECAHLSHSNGEPLFMCLHLFFCCPFSNRISHAITKCRMTILISSIPCLTARVADMVEFEAQVSGHEATEKANRIQAWQGLLDWQLADRFDRGRPVLLLPGSWWSG